MTARRNEAILLFAVSVALLLVVSARAGAGENTGGGDAVLSREEFLRSNDTLEGTDEALDAPLDIREVFPGMEPSDWNLRLANDTYLLEASFEPAVVEVRDGESIDARVADKLEEMMENAEAAGYTICIRTGYRPYQTQAYLFYGRASQISESQKIDYEEAEEMARKTVAYPGASDHQTGLGVDLMDRRDTTMAAGEVENLPVLRWLRAHCAEYGFIARYPRDKQELTGHFEPWHFRYVGEDAAEYITENNLCLEEFIELF